MLRTSFLTIALAACAVLGGCVDDDYTFNGTDPATVDSSTGDTAATDAPGAETDVEVGDGRCKTDGDCSGDLANPLCNVTTGKCVECISDARCGAKTYCNPAGSCVDGCKNDTDCPTATGDAGVDADNPDARFSALRCDTTLHMCVGCKTDDVCPSGFLCTVSDGVCRPGCTETHACQTNRDCCAGKCLDTAKETTNCGGCGVACPTPANTTMKCERDTTTMKGVCKVATCAAGFANCNSDATDGCETDILTKTDNCGGCGTACTIANGTGVCEMGVCKVATCGAGFGNCDGLHTNGCEQALNTVSHCGACGTGCAPTNAAGECSTGSCKVLACISGFGNCDGADGNGCEINLKNNVDNCNACGTKCPTTSGAPSCVAGVCKFSTCGPGLGDCDGSGTCSTMITNNIANCGACGRTCAAASGTAQCVGTSCSIASCTAGFGDCNASYIDGCETKLDTLANCGACGAACSRPNASASCTTGSCQINTCSTNFGNCDGTDANGCEKSLAADVNNCGLCGRTCAVTNGVANCIGGTCGLASCNAGFANCDSNNADCERSFATASNSCMMPEQLGSAAGMCGYRLPATATGTASSTKFFKLRLLASGCSGICKVPDDAIRARFTLTNPAGIAYDLFVYSGTTCGAPVASIIGTAGGTASVNYNSAACTQRDLIVEVRYKSGSNCGTASVTVDTATP